MRSWRRGSVDIIIGLLCVGSWSLARANVAQADNTVNTQEERNQAANRNKAAVVNSAGDNSCMNKEGGPCVHHKHDGMNSTETADEQSNSERDVEITRKIRSAITSRDLFSTYAKNVKVIVQNGKVVLKGPVRTDNERRSIENIAVKVAGAGRVKNELEITPK